MHLFRFSALAIAISVILSGCGSNQSSNTSKTTTTTDTTTTTPTTPATFTTLNGVVADGYIQGAIVCLDKNTNLLCDTGETQAVTNTKGEFTLKDVNTNDVANFPVIAIVPVGAIDQDDPANPITKSYTLTAPIGKHAFISPITSLVKAHQDYSALSLDEASQEVASQLATTDSELFTDYAGSTSSREQKRLHNLAKLAAKAFQDTTQALTGHAEYTAKIRQTIAVRGFLLQVNSLLTDVSADGYSSVLPTLNVIADSANSDLLKLSTLPRAKAPARNVLLNNNSTFALQTIIEPTNCTDGPTPTCSGYSPRAFVYATTTITQPKTDTYFTQNSGSILDLQTGGTDNLNPSALMILGTNGWVALPTSNDDSVTFSDNMAVHQSLTTPRSYNETIVAGPVDNLSIHHVLTIASHSLLNNQSNFFDLLPVTNANFPKGSISYTYSTTLNVDEYVLSDTNITDSSFTAPLVTDIHNPEQTFTTLNATQTYFSNNWLKPTNDVYNTEILLAADGSFNIRKTAFTDGQPVVINMTDKGAWDQRTVNGQTLTVLHFPKHLNPFNGADLFWTVQNGQVVQGFFSPKGRIIQNIAFNKIAFDALKAAIVLTPAP